MFSQLNGLIAKSNIQRGVFSNKIDQNIFIVFVVDCGGLSDVVRKSHLQSVSVNTPLPSSGLSGY
jgi:hypothetical protein